MNKIFPNSILHKPLNEMNNMKEMAGAAFSIYLAIAMSVSMLVISVNKNTSDLDKQAEERMEQMQAGEYSTFKDFDVWPLYDQEIESLKLDDGLMFLGFVNVKNGSPVSKDTIHELIYTARGRYLLNKFKFKIEVIPAPQGLSLNKAHGVPFFDKKTTTVNDLIIVARPTTFDEFINLSPNIDSIIAVNPDEATILRDYFKEHFEAIDPLGNIKAPKYITGIAIPKEGTIISDNQRSALESFIPKEVDQVANSVVIKEEIPGLTGFPVGSILFYSNSTDTNRIGYQNPNR